MNSLCRQAFLVCGLAALITVGCDSVSTQSAADSNISSSARSDPTPSETSLKDESISSDQGTSTAASEAAPSDSPAAAYQVYNEALIDGRYHIVYEWLATTSRPAFVLLAGDMAAMRIDHDDKHAHDALDRAARDYGVPTSAMGFYLRHENQSDDQLAESILRVYEAIDDPRAYLEDVSRIFAMAELDPSDAESYEDDRRETVVDVRIKGNSAQGTIVETADDPGSPVEFKRHDDRWGVVSDYRIGRRDGD